MRQEQAGSCDYLGLLWPGQTDRIWQKSIANNRLGHIVVMKG